MENKQFVFTVDHNKLKATIEDNATTRDFIKKLPITLTMHDLYRREKYANVSGLTVDKINTPHYSKEDISYWTPGEAFVIYYEGNQEALSGLVKMGRLLDGVNKLASYPGDVEVTIALEDKEEDEQIE